MSAGRNDSQRIWASQSVASCALCKTHRRHTSVSVARWVGASMPDICWRMLTYADVCWRMLTYADVCKTHRCRHTSVSIARWVGARIKLILNVNEMLQLARSLIHKYAILVPVCPSLSDRWVFSYILHIHTYIHTYILGAFIGLCVSIPVFPNFNTQFTQSYIVDCSSGCNLQT
jgi:hypothetical protein